MRGSTGLGLTSKEVVEMRKLVKPGGRLHGKSLVTVGTEFGVGPGEAQHAITGEGRYAHIGVREEPYRDLLKAIHDAQDRRVANALYSLETTPLTTQEKTLIDVALRPMLKADGQPKRQSQRKQRQEEKKRMQHEPAEIGEKPVPTVTPAEPPTPIAQQSQPAKATRAKHSWSTVTAEEAFEILYLYLNDHMKMVDIERLVGRSDTTIGAIVRFEGEKWGLLRGAWERMHVVQLQLLRDRVEYKYPRQANGQRAKRSAQLPPATPTPLAPPVPTPAPIRPAVQQAAMPTMREALVRAGHAPEPEQSEEEPDSVADVDLPRGTVLNLTAGTWHFGRDRQRPIYAHLWRLKSGTNIIVSACGITMSQATARERLTADTKQPQCAHCANVLDRLKSLAEERRKRRDAERAAAAQAQHNTAQQQSAQHSSAQQRTEHSSAELKAILRTGMEQLEAAMDLCFQTLQEVREKLSQLPD